MVIALDTHSEKNLLKVIHGLLSECSVAIAHNGDKFDFKKLNTRFLHHGLTPPAPYKTIDTRSVARRFFGFASNSLNDLAKEFGIGEKVHHEGFPLWKKCMAGDKAAFKKMKRYNIQDVDLLEKIYLRFLPWIKSHPNVSDGSGCPKCESKNIQYRGTVTTQAAVYRKFQCNNCRGWGKERKSVASYGLVNA